MVTVSQLIYKYTQRNSIEVICHILINQLLSTAAETAVH